MPDSSRVEIRLLREPDIAAAMDLKNSAGWNQTESDWRVLLQLEPNGCFAAVLDDQVVGTTTTTSYGRELAWIGMVLVRPEKRRRGSATKLVQTALAHLEHCVGAIKLDATADGKLVYERLGFEVESWIERWRRKGEASKDGPPETMESDTWRQILQLDRSVFGADRSKLLKLLLASSCVPPVVTRNEGSVTGYGLARAGSNGAYVGPIVSSQSSQAIELFDRLFEQFH